MLRKRILHCFPFLATQPGRALLHFYAGTLNPETALRSDVDQSFLRVPGWYDQHRHAAWRVLGLGLSAQYCRYSREEGLCKVSRAIGIEG